MGKKIHSRYVKQAVETAKPPKATKQKKMTKGYQLEHEEYHWQKKRTNQGTECEEKRSSADLEIYDESNENNNYQLIRTEAIELLNGASMPSRFKFRDQELQIMSKFVDQCICQEKQGLRFLMVTGSPGLGKTLSVTTTLQRKNCKTIKLNANITKSVREVQNSIYSELISSKVPVNLTTNQLINCLIDAKINETIIIYIQQIEVIFRNNIDSYSHEFLSLFHHKQLGICLIGISNAIDTLEQYFGKLGYNYRVIQNIVFRPYDVDKIIQIITDKLGEIKKKTDIQINFPQSLLRYTAQHLQNQKKGDLRFVISFMKQMIIKMFLKQTNSNNFRFTITIDLINSIFIKMENPKQTLIESLPCQQQLMLIAIYVIIQKKDLLFITQKILIQGMRWACKSLKLQYKNNIIKESLSELQQYGLVKVMTKRSKQQDRITLLVNRDDILSLSSHPSYSKLFEESETPNSIH